MAIAINQTRVNGNSVLNAKLIDSAVATTDGEWIDIRGLQNYNIHITGITTGTVQIYGSNTDAKPANNVDHILLTTASTADEMKSFADTNVRWIKAKVSAWTTGTFDVILEGTFNK